MKIKYFNLFKKFYNIIYIYFYYPKMCIINLIV